MSLLFLHSVITLFGFNTFYINWDFVSTFLKYITQSDLLVKHYEQYGNFIYIYIFHNYCLIQREQYSNTHT